MKTRRHGVLFTALTLVLGFAVLSTTIVAPHVQLVGHDAVARRIYQKQAFDTEAALGKLWENVKNADNVPTGDLERIYPKGDPNYFDLDILSPVIEHADGDVVPGKMTPDRPALPWDQVDSPAAGDVDRIIVPGTHGSYNFTIEADLDCDYEFEILLSDDFTFNADGGALKSENGTLIDATANGWAPIPMRYRLRNVTTDKWIALAGGGTYTTATAGLAEEGTDEEKWNGVTLDELGKALEAYFDFDPSHGESGSPVQLAAGERHEFQLDWKWPFETKDASDDAMDDEDTDIGKQVQGPDWNDLPYYRLMMNLIMSATEIPIVTPPGGGTVTLTFDANYPGGAVSPPSKEYARNAQIGLLSLLPEPTRPGYKFDGWFNDKECTDPVSPTFVLTANKTIYAKWVEEDEFDDPVLLVFDANYPGGTVTPPSREYERYDVVGPLQDLPTPTRPDYKFDGWYHDAACTQPVLQTYVLTADVTTIYAKWSEITPDGEKVVVTFDPNGVDASVFPISKEYEVGDPIGPLTFLPIPTRPGYVFDGWYYDEGFTKPVLPTDIVTDDITVHAKWLKLEPDPILPPWIWLLPPVIAAPLIPVIGAVALLPGVPILLGGLGLLGIGGLTGLGGLDCCWRCLRPCGECVCEGKCRNPDCRVTDDDADIEKKPPVAPPKTGDSMTVALSTLTMMTLAGAAALILIRKRREEDDE